MAKAKVQINEASREELAGLPGIGPATAETLIKLRKQKGGFKSVDELEEVPGIGAQTLRELRTHVAVSKNGGSGPRKASEAASKPAESGAKAAEAGAKATETNGARMADKGAEGVRTGADAAREAVGTQREAFRETANAQSEAVGRATETASRATENVGRAAETGAATAKDMADKAVNAQHDVLGALREAQEAWFGLVQEQVTANMQAARRLAECRTVQDFAGFQAEYLRDSMNRFVTGSTRVAGPARHLAGLWWSPERWQQLAGRR